MALSPLHTFSCSSPFSFSAQLCFSSSGSWTIFPYVLVTFKTFFFLLDPLALCLHLLSFSSQHSEQLQYSLWQHGACCKGLSKIVEAVVLFQIVFLLKFHIKHMEGNCFIIRFINQYWLLWKFLTNLSIDWDSILSP